MGRAALAFLIVWLPYIAATGVAERGLGPAWAGEGAMLVAALMIWPAARLARSDFGLARGGGLAMAAMFALAALVLLLRWVAADALGIAAFGPGDHLVAASALPMLLLSTFLPSLAEDVLTRGFALFAWPSRRWRPWALVTASAALYTLNHLWRFDAGWSEQARLFALGLAFAAAAWRFDSLWPAVGLHWGGNLLPTLLGQRMEVSILSVDGDRLLSAGLHLLVAIALLAWPVRRLGHSMGRSAG